MSRSGPSWRASAPTSSPPAPSRSPPCCGTTCNAGARWFAAAISPSTERKADPGRGPARRLWRAVMEQVMGLAPSGSLGSGYNIEAFKRGMSLRPDFIGQDAGSTDMGPYYHGSGKPFLPRATYKHDLSIMLRAARAAKIPLLVGSALTSGCNESLETAIEIIKEIAAENGLSFRMATIQAELDKPDLKRRMAKAPLESIGPDGALTPDVIDRCGPIVAQMG